MTLHEHPSLTPGSPEWARRVSPSKAAAILGISPFDSPYSMWRKMRGDIPWDDETPAMERGNLCEPAVLAWWRKHHPHDDWREQATLTIGDWLLATPDALCVVDGKPVLVEAKTASNDWDGEVPPHYRAQVDLAMHVCHLNDVPVVEAHVPVLGGRRLLFTNHVLPYVPEYGAAILAKTKAFYDSLDGPMPDLDDTVATYEAVRKVHPDIAPKATVELDWDTAFQLVFNQALAKHTETVTRGCKSRVIDAMGRAQYATYAGVTIARRQTHGADVRFVVVAKPADLPDPENEVAA